MSKATSWARSGLGRLRSPTTSLVVLMRLFFSCMIAMSFCLICCTGRASPSLSLIDTPVVIDIKMSIGNSLCMQRDQGRPLCYDISAKRIDNWKFVLYYRLISIFALEEAGGAKNALSLRRRDHSFWRRNERAKMVVSIIIALDNSALTFFHFWSHNGCWQSTFLNLE